ncbi:hypothetical protein E5E96_05555 [Aeromonas sp. 1805]|uniref:hypothetical protein n=1 Tax=Aeromonas sp. 1805 TaxID=2560028 RepID=UPI00148B30D2|nr:hypothetical protein [Aeromonas sp. 1805]QJT16798.1 hypothetical protein E5E96_05555 [Aeromonas sp. 1805]
MMNELTQDEIMVLERVLVKPELQSHFFSKIKNLKWFEALKNKGLLDPSCNPPPINTEGDYWSIPTWPVTEYLVRSSEALILNENIEYAKAYINLIRDITLYSEKNNLSNYRTWWQFAKILKFVPVDILTPDDICLVRYWLNDRFDRHLVGMELAVWLETLLDAPNPHTNTLAMLLLDEIFHINSIDSKYDTKNKSPVFRIDEYSLSLLSKKLTRKISDVFNYQALIFFEKKLIQALDISGKDKWSNIWRNAIEDHKQDVAKNDTIDILLQCYRDIFISLNHETHKANIHLENALNSKYQIIQRVAIFVASELYDVLEYNILLKIIDPTFFNDKYRHELWRFLNKRFAKFDLNIKRITLETIDNLSVKNDDNSIDEQATAYKKSIWYSAIKEHDIFSQGEYNKCIAITKREPEHPDFSFYSTISAGPGESPASLIDLRIMLQKPEKLITFLNEYEHVGHFGEPGIEGLVKVFGELVEAEIEHILDYSGYLLKLKPHYHHELFSAFDNAWRDKKNLKWNYIWPELLKFTQTLLMDNDFWTPPSISSNDAFIGNSNWVVSKLSQLIEAGCKKDDHSFGIDNINQAKLVLEIMLQNIKGEKFSIDDDAVFISINSSRGRCLEAYINLALYECRNFSQNHEAVWKNYSDVFNDELTKPEMNEYEFSVLVSMYLSNFLYLSEDWLSMNLELIFGEARSQRWLCAIQGFCYTSGFDTNVYDLFKRKNFFEELLNTPHLNDEVKGQFIERICLVHLWGRDDLSSNESPLALINNRGHYNELRKIVWWFWSIHDDAHQKGRDIVFKLFPTLVERAVDNGRDAQLLASDLCLWIAYIDVLDINTISWLSTIAPYVDKAHNTNYFLEGLARLSSSYPLEVSHIWKLTLIESRHFYDDKSIKTLFNNILKLGHDGQLIAKEIADCYLIHGAQNIVSIYTQSQNDA